MERPLETVYTEYQASPEVTSLVNFFSAQVDPTAIFDFFYDNIWNVNTAVGYGLDVLGRIVGVQRVLTIPTPTRFFGFDTGTNGFAPWNQAPFRNADSSPTTSNYPLSDTAFRRLIFAKAMANISGTNAPALNKILQLLFAGRGRCYVLNLGQMTMRYVFEFPPLPYEIAIITTAGVLPSPTGVGVQILIQPMPGTFLYRSSGGRGTPWGYGTFRSNTSLSTIA